MLMLFGSGSEHVIHCDPTKGISQVIIVLGLSNSVLRWRSLGSDIGHLRVKLIEVSAELIERCINLILVLDHVVPFFSVNGSLATHGSAEDNFTVGRSVLKRGQNVNFPGGIAVLCREHDASH